MFRFMRLSRKLPSCRQFLHTIKSRELDEPAYYKKPLDPEVIALVKKFDADIFYSSYVEMNKKSLSLSQRMKIQENLGKEDYKNRLNNARESEPSVFIDKLNKVPDDTPNNKMPVEIKSTIDSSNSVSEQIKEQNEEEKLQLARSKLKILTEMGLRRSAIEYEMQAFPDNWMEDYETYDENDYLTDTHYGTADPNVPVSKVPCHGCGSLLQCADSSLPGYLPSELMRDHEKSVLKRLICQRCHFLKTYNTALKVQVKADDYVEMISKIKDEKALAILMVDLVDFPCSLWPNIVDIIGEKRPVIIVGNKIDLLPQDSKEYLNHIIKCLENGLIEFGLSKANIKHICLVSARTNYGIEELITSLYTFWPNKGDVYLMGNANVGKSTLFNALLRSDYCKLRARNLIRRATSSLWPGTTLRMLKFPIARPSSALLVEREKRLKNENRQKQKLERLRITQIYSGRTPDTTLMDHIGQTFEALPESKIESAVHLTDAPPFEKYFNENSKIFKQSKWLYDTPGVIQEEQTINLLTSAELLHVIPKQTLWPRVFYVHPGQTLFLSGLGRVDYLGGSSEMRLSVFASDELSILIVRTEKADEIYKELVGTELINVPRGDRQRLQDWPPLKRQPEKISVANYTHTEKISVCDIVLSSAGWVSVNMLPSETGHFHAWTPDCRGIFVRKPSLLPYAGSMYRGKRIKFTPAYARKEPKNLIF